MGKIARNLTDLSCFVKGNLLDLSAKKFNKKSTALLIDVLARIPAEISILDWSNNSLGEKTGDDLALIFAKIPPRIIKLILNNNCFFRLTGNQLACALAAIPTTIRHLSLDNQDFGYMHSTEVIQSLLPLSTTLLNLDLGTNNLHRFTGSELAMLFKILPQQLQQLSLHNNGFFTKSEAELRQAFPQLPSSLKVLDLHRNHYCERLFGMSQSLTTIPANIIHLNLSWNYFNYLSEETGFFKIPPGVKILDLSNNDFHSTKTANLKSLMTELPPSLLSLDLSYNNLLTKPITHLTEIFALLPLSLETLILNDHGNVHKSQQTITELLPVFPIHLKQVIIDEQLIKLDYYWAERFLHALLHFIDTQNPAFPSFELFSFCYEIDEIIMNILINQLEQIATPQAYLACALLLEGRIKNNYNLGKRCEIEYIEKRMHDAVTFYEKAAQDKEIRPLCDFILLELKMVTTIPSLAIRLKQFGMEPMEKFFLSYPYFSNHNTQSELPRLTRFSLFFARENQGITRLFDVISGTEPTEIRSGML